MDDLLADFVAETREMLEASSGEIVAWEADPSDRARLDAIFRFVHTVKGNCGFFDFPRLARLSHAAEDALAACRAGRREPDRALVSAALAIIDRIGGMVDAIEAGQDFAAGGDDELIAALHQRTAAEPNETALPLPLPPVSQPDGDAQAASQATRTQPMQRSIRLPVELLDEVMKGVSDMVLARNDLARHLRETGAQSTIDGPFERLSIILADVRNAITRMRMQRLEHLFGSIPRLIRDLSHELGKQVMVEFEGGDVELDREMIEMIRDPLTHIIRNAIDHGIEGPDERTAAGKRRVGLLRFAARQSGNQIALFVTDDGRGLDTERLAAKAVAAGIRTPAEIEVMSERQRQHLVFAPGLSTAEVVTEVSGRGVGMDVVRANLEKVGGSIDVTSQKGDGTSVCLRLPLTLSIIAALTVEAAGQRYAIPRNFVEEVVFGGAAQLDFARVGERWVANFRGHRIPCLALADVLGVECGASVRWVGKTLVIARLVSGEIFALAVDRVLDHEDVVVKPVAPGIMATGLYAGTTLLDDGRPIMLLDLPGIAAMRDLVGSARDFDRLPEDSTGGEETPGLPVMLFVGLDGRRRGVRLDLIRRIDTVDCAAIDIEGARAQVVVERQILTLAGHTCGPLPDARCRLLRLYDGNAELAYAVREVCDVATITEEIAPAAGAADIEGVALVDGQPVPLIGGHALFATLAPKRSGGRTMTCRLPDDDWARTMLAPLLEAGGYRITHDAAEEADVAILLSEDADPPVRPARSHIRLRPEPDAGPADAGTIYRYDSDGLFAALQRLQGGVAR